MIRMLLRSDIAERLGRLHKSVTPTAEQRAEFAAARAARPKLAATLPGARAAAARDPENYAVVGNVAQITVEGVLSEEPDFWAWLYGMDGTTYEDIRDAFALAATDPTVTSVIMAVSSPGGYVDGLFETLGTIEAFGKPITVQSSQACSAAYALSAMAGKITALGPASCFGSIGVACSYDFYTAIETIDVTSTEAPNKRPDPRTPEGKAVIVAELDAIHELFADAIARGRSRATGKTYTVDQVNSDFGRGGTMLSEAAKAAGLIDKMPRAPKSAGSSAAAEDLPPAPPAPPIAVTQADPRPPPASAAGAAPPQSPPCSAGQANRKKPMTEEELLAQFPNLHAAVLAKGKEQGLTSERKRISSHFRTAKIHGAKLAGSLAVAVKHIDTGSSIQDDEVHVEYQEAGAAHRETASRQDDSDEAGRALDGAKAPTPQTLDNGDKVAAAMGLSAPKKTAA
jgi:ClpP class serine protease